MLVQSLAAPTAAVFGWSFLHESYNLQQALGMAITLAGVCAVILEKSRDAAPAKKLQTTRVSCRGVAFAFAAMFGQAGGLLLSKSGMQTDAGYLDAFSATQIRALAASCCFVIYFTVASTWHNVRAALNNRKAVAFTAIGAVIGPFIGVSMSLMALHYLATGVASTFFSLIPICIIPFSIYLHKEHVSLLAIAGAIVAVFGVYLLMV